MSRRKKVLVAHQHVPTHDMLGCDQRVLSVVKAFSLAGYEVHFAAKSENPQATQLHYDLLRESGVTRVWEGLTEEHVVEMSAIRYELVVIWVWYWGSSRSSFDVLFGPLHSAQPGMPVVAATDDVHALNDKSLGLSRWMKVWDSEVATYARAAAVLTITRTDAERIASVLNVSTPVGILPYSWHDEPAVRADDLAATSLESRSGLLFVGNDHVANTQAMEWFVKYCFPLVLQRRPQEKLHVVGRMECPKGKNVVCHGQVSMLRDLLLATRVFVSPIMAGTGLKTKNVLALRNGLPLVTTQTGAQGMLVESGEQVYMVGQMQSAEAFAALVLDVLEDDALWRRLSANGLRFTEERFSMAAAVRAVTQLGLWARKQGKLPGQV